MIECSQCEQPIGGHDPKCVIEGAWWCEQCVYILEMELLSRTADEFRERKWDELERLMEEPWNASGEATNG